MIPEKRLYWLSYYEALTAFTFLALCFGDFARGKGSRMVFTEGKVSIR